MDKGFPKIGGTREKQKYSKNFPVKEKEVVCGKVIKNRYKLGNFYCVFLQHLRSIIITSNMSFVVSPSCVESPLS